MQSYLKIIEDILENGKHKAPTRYENGVAVPVENSTIGLPSVYWQHNMSEGFPLLTCRKMPFKSMSVELEGFIHGVTDKKWYQDRGCKFWDFWASPAVIQDAWDGICKKIYNQPPIDANTKKQLQQKLTDLGPIYGSQWRRFNEIYDFDLLWGDRDFPSNGIETGFDQFDYMVKTLKTNPYDRRMVCSAWNPNQQHLMALPPCHLLWNVSVFQDELSLHWHQRSCDTLRGIPNNIASYALLMLLLCKESGFKPGKLSALFMDCHLYDNDIEQSKELLNRPTHQLPEVEFTKWDGIYNWTHEDVKLVNYVSEDTVSFNKITV